VGQPDLFVVCKSCGSEVSPYITECPYCGNRLRKRAPKLDKGGVPKPPKQRRRRTAPSLGRMRRGEIPGIRTDGRPYATMALVLAAIVFTLLLRANVVHPDAVLPVFDHEWYRRAAALFFYESTAYEVVALGTVFVFGWLLERRHGPWAPLLVFAVGSAAGAALALLVDPDAVFAGANGGALALLAAWAVRDLIAARRGQEIESDLLGVAAVAVLLLLLPAAISDASGLFEPDPFAGLGGAVAGLILGHALARAPER
jgi:membrane associated rhomboid family serine protease